MKPTDEKWWVAPALIVLAASIFLYALTLAYFENDKALLNVMCGAAIVMAQRAFDWRFSSSKGSQDKDAVAAERGAKSDDTLAVATAALATSIPAPVNGKESK